MAEPGVARHGERELAVAIGVAGAVGGYAKSGRPEHIGRNPGKVGTVGAAAEGNDERLIAG